MCPEKVRLKNEIFNESITRRTTCSVNFSLIPLPFCWCKNIFGMTTHPEGYLEGMHYISWIFLNSTIISTMCVQGWTFLFRPGSPEEKIMIRKSQPWKIINWKYFSSKLVFQGIVPPKIDVSGFCITIAIWIQIQA